MSDLSVELFGIETKTVDVTSFGLTNVHAKSNNTNVRVHVNSDSEVIIDSLDINQTADITLLGDSNGAYRTKLIAVTVTPVQGMPTVTPVNVVASDMNAISLGNWPVDNDNALVDIKGLPQSSVVTGAHTYNGSVATPPTTIADENDVVTVTETEYATLRIEAPAGTATLGIQIRARVTY